MPPTNSASARPLDGGATTPQGYQYQASLVSDTAPRGTNLERPPLPDGQLWRSSRPHFLGTARGFAVPVLHRSVHGRALRSCFVSRQGSLGATVRHVRVHSRRCLGDLGFTLKGIICTCEICKAWHDLGQRLPKCAYERRGRASRDLGVDSGRSRVDGPADERSESANKCFLLSQTWLLDGDEGWNDDGGSADGGSDHD